MQEAWARPHHGSPLFLTPLASVLKGQSLCPHTRSRHTCAHAPLTPSACVSLARSSYSMEAHWWPLGHRLLCHHQTPQDRQCFHTPLSMTVPASSRLCQEVNSSIPEASGSLHTSPAPMAWIPLPVHVWSLKPRLGSRSGVWSTGSNRPGRL